jgi:hypothetical protein
MSNKTLVTVFSVVLIAIGLLGFVNNPVLGLFEVNLAHNLVHLLSGVLGFVLLMQGETGAVLFGKIMTVVYGAVTVLGFLLVPSGGLLLGLVQVNSLDHGLHLLLTVVFAYVGFINRPSTAKA